MKKRSTTVFCLYAKEFIQGKVKPCRMVKRGIAFKNVNLCFQFGASFLCFQSQSSQLCAETTKG